MARFRKSVAGAEPRRIDVTDWLQLEGRTVLVTGAAKGLGRTIAFKLVEQGASVIGVDIDPPDGGHDEGVRWVKADLALESEIEAAADQAVGDDSPLHGLVLNAGIQAGGSVADSTTAFWDEIQAVNVRGAFLLLRRLWPSLIAADFPRVVATASTSSFASEIGNAPYIASKHALLGLVRAAALEGQPHDLLVNAVGPAWMRTVMGESSNAELADYAEQVGISFEELMKALLRRQGERMIDPDAVADLILFLVSPRLNDVTGTIVPVDRGATLDTSFRDHLGNVV